MNARCKGAHDPENSKAQRARAGFIDLHPPEPEARKTFAWSEPNTANENSRTTSPGSRFNLTAFWSDARSHRQTSIRGSKRKACAAMQGSRESERMSVPDAQLLGLALLTLRAACGWRSPSGRFTEREGCFPSHVRCCQTHWQVSLRMFKPEGLVSCSPGVPSESECSPGNPVSRPIPVRSRTPSGFRPSDQPCGRASSSTRL